MTQPIFERDGERFVATPLARGPWDPAACHGGAPAALLAALVDATPSLVPMQGVRLTYDLVRPVPVDTPLTVSINVTREGKRIQVVEVALRTAADATEFVRCRALRLRTTDVQLPADRPTAGAPLTPGPADLDRYAGTPGVADVGFWAAVDVRFVEGALGVPSPGAAWFRVAVPLADGVELTPLARVAAAADFGNGIAGPLAMGPFVYINPDLTVDVHRLPVTEWVSLTSTSVAQPTGVGLTTSLLGDEQGAIGTALQSLYVDATG